MATTIFEALDREHRAIETILDLLERGVPEDAPWEFHTRVVDFLREFADRYHHAREEDILFPLMVERGVPREDGPIGCMLAEHESGRRHVRNMKKAIEAQDRETFRVHASEFSDLLRAHIIKEDRILYPMARRVLTKKDQSALVRQFAEIDATMVAERAHISLADEVRASNSDAAAG